MQSHKSTATRCSRRLQLLHSTVLCGTAEATTRAELQRRRRARVHLRYAFHQRDLRMSRAMRLAIAK